MLVHSVQEVRDNDELDASTIPTKLLHNVVK